MTEYSDLSSKIISFTEVSSSVFSDTVVDYLLENAQHRMMREVDLPVFRRTDTGTLTASSPFVALPVNCLIIRSFHYLDGSSNNVFLLPKERSYCIEYGKKRSTTGTPKYYARYDEDKLYIAPTPSSALSFELSYIADIIEKYGVKLCGTAGFDGKVIEGKKSNIVLSYAGYDSGAYSVDFCLVVNGKTIFTEDSEASRCYELREEGAYYFE